MKISIGAMLEGQLWAKRFVVSKSLRRKGSMEQRSCAVQKVGAWAGQESQNPKSKKLLKHEFHHIKFTMPYDDWVAPGMLIKKLSNQGKP